MQNLNFFIFEIYKVKIINIQIRFKKKFSFVKINFFFNEYLRYFIKFYIDTVFIYINKNFEII